MQLDQLDKRDRQILNLLQDNGGLAMRNWQRRSISRLRHA